MKIKITNDGTPYGTKMFNAETGEEIDIGSLATIIWENRIDEAPRVFVEFVLPKIEVEGELVLAKTIDRVEGDVKYKLLFDPKPKPKPSDDDGKVGK